MHRLEETQCDLEQAIERAKHTAKITGDLKMG